MTKEPGILAIWHDCAAGSEETFEHWYQNEHLIERVSVPGFRCGRRYEVCSGDRQYFTYYEADTPEVFTGSDYVDRLNDPTPLTREVMSGIFVRPSRTVCRRVSRSGSIEGSFAVTAVTSDDTALQAWQRQISALPQRDGIANIQTWSAVDGASDVGSREQKLRGGDDVIAGCLFVSVLRENDVEAVYNWMNGVGIAAEQISSYRLLCQLHTDSL